MNIMVSLHETPCSFVHMYRRFGGAYWIHVERDTVWSGTFTKLYGRHPRILSYILSVALFQVLTAMILRNRLMNGSRRFERTDVPSSSQSIGARRNAATQVKQGVFCRCTTGGWQKEELVVRYSSRTATLSFETSGTSHPAIWHHIAGDFFSVRYWDTRDP
jgi:hypothetical protein